MLGFNSRESCQDAIFDIQTQALSGDRVLETRIYRNGKILATVRSTYGEDDGACAVRESMARQHETICGRVRDGNYALIFLWTSRGVIHFEAGEYALALEFFESVLAIDAENAEVRGHLDAIGERLTEDPALGKTLRDQLERMAEEMERAGRRMEADRRRALINLIGLAAPSRHDPGRHPPVRGPRPLSFSALRAGVTSPRFSRSLLAAFCFLLLVLCVGLIQADTQVKLSPRFHARVAAGYLEGENVLAARDLYGKLLLQDPGSRDALSGFWATFHRAGDHPSAIPTLKQIADFDRAGPWAAFCLAEAYRSASRCDEAIPLYLEAIERGVPRAEGELGLGMCLLEQRREEAAVHLWEPLLEQGPEDFRIHACLGRAYERQGLPGRASVHYAEALRLTPSSPTLSLALAGALEAMHQAREAQALRERAARLTPEDPGPPRAPWPFNEPLSALPGPWAPPATARF